nr:DUF1990 domain-containing protein [Nakamurella flavida]
MTYPEIGATRDEVFPGGYHHLSVTRTIGRGDAAFALAAERVMSWQVQRRTGLRIEATAATAHEGDDVLLGLGVGPLTRWLPCRVVYTVEEPRRAGWAYGTLPGHPEAGEERFLVVHEPDDTVTFTVEAFSRPAWWPVRLAGPIGRAVQRLVSERYVRALG